MLGDKNKLLETKEEYEEINTEIQTLGYNKCD